MENQYSIPLILGVFVVAIAIVIALIFARYRRDIQAARMRILDAGSQVIETECGPVEFVTFGKGDPVLVVHGILGGFDQGLVIARGNIGDGFQSIIPSRFGYLGTPLPENASPATQADAFACLLDELSIQAAAVLGTSAGGTSAIQFALHHPDRCSALVLFASNAPGETEAALPPEPVVNGAFKSDFIFWLLTTYFRSNLKSIMGVPDGFELTPEYEADIAEVMKTILPVNPRSDGAVFDMFVSNPDINSGYPLNELTLPVLIVNAIDDPLTLYKNAKAMSEEIPGARLFTIESGGHMFLGQEDIVKSAITSFLEEQSAPEPE